MRSTPRRVRSRSTGAGRLGTDRQVRLGARGTAQRHARLQCRRQAGRRAGPRIRGRAGAYARPVEARAHVCGRRRRRSTTTSRRSSTSRSSPTSNADESPDSPNAAVVSSAFVALGGYFLDGIKGTYVAANPGARRRDVQLRGVLFQRLRTRSTTSRASTSKARASRRIRVRPRAGSISRPRRAITPRRRCSGIC